MAFEPKKFNDLYEAMRGRTTTALTDFEVGSVTRTMFESFAYELGGLYQKMNLVYLSGFVDSADGSHLDNVVSILGIQRSLPDFAVGEVTFIRDKGNAEVTIPVGTLVATEEKPDKPKKVYVTNEDVVLTKDQLEAVVNIQALERGASQNADPETIVVMPRPIVGIKTVTNTEGVKLIGRQRETDEELRRRAKNALLSSGKANITALENAVLALPGVLDVRIIERFNPTSATKDFGFGMVEVVVDAPEYSTKETIKNKIKDTVENVRAAGVYALVKEASKILVTGVFRIEAAQGQNFNATERLAFEQKVQSAIEDFLRSTKMGQPLLFSKMMKAILSVEGVDDLKEFRIAAGKVPNTGEIVYKSYTLNDNNIPSLELERFYGRGLKDEPIIFVASEAKDLPVNITFKATGLDKTKLTAVETSLKTYLETTLKIGQVVQIEPIRSAIANVSGAITDLKIQPQSWRFKSPFPSITTDYTPTFVETPKKGLVFGYNNKINLDGAALISVPNGTTDDGKKDIVKNIRSRAELFLDALAPEADFVLDDFLTDIKKVDKVLDLKWVEKDWSAFVDATTENRWSNNKVDIKPFEKAFLSSSFLVATDVAKAEVKLEAVGIKIRKGQSYPTTDTAKVATDKALFVKAITDFFTNLKQGDDVKFGDLQNVVQDVSIGYTFSVTALTLALGTQKVSLTDIRDLKVRIAEAVVLKLPLTIDLSVEPESNTRIA